MSVFDIFPGSGPGDEEPERNPFPGLGRDPDPVLDAFDVVTDQLHGLAAAMRVLVNELRKARS